MTYLFSQEQAHDQFMQEYIEYAKSIGCTVVHDSVTATPSQARQLHAWWTTRRLGEAIGGFRTSSK